MIKENQLAWDSRRERLRYGLGAVCIGIAALLLLLSFRGGAAQGLAAPLAPLQTVTSVKSIATSIEETNNDSSQAVAGELVTVTVVYQVSGGTIYDASPRVALADGLYPIASSPTWSEMYTGTAAVLRNYEGEGNRVARNGALVIFPNQGTIVGTDTITMIVYAVRTQNQYVGTANVSGELRTQAILRWCAGAPGCDLYNTTGVHNNDTRTQGQVWGIQPTVDAACTETYLDSAHVGAGGGLVRLSFGGYPNNDPTAYNTVFTATISAGLDYSDSNEGVYTDLGNGTYRVVWNKPILPAGIAWQPMVTATLPGPTFIIGPQYTCQGATTFETFAGDVPYEGKYSATGTRILRPGLSAVLKRSDPGSGAVTMGDRITYTVVFTQGADTLLQAAQVVDTQPLGFHYIDGTFDLQNAAASFSTQAGGTGNLYQTLKWVMGDLEPSTQPRVVTATYATLNTGLNYNGAAVYVTAPNMRTTMASISANITGAVLSWTPPPGSTYSAATRANALALGVIQPYMGDNFSTLRFDAGLKEVGEDLNFITRFRNNGYSVTAIPAIPAHELQVCDTLPPGLIFQTNQGCFNTTNSTACPFSFTPPPDGATGEVCWTVPALPKSTNTYEFRYVVRVTDVVYPGVYTNHAFVKTYSSQPGEVEGERLYTYGHPIFSHAAPSANCGVGCYEILGLAASKTASTDLVAPGDVITYVLAITDTSALSQYTGLVLIDTYDSLLTYEMADPLPSDHNVDARQLTWNLGNLPNDSSRQITLTMRVSSEIADRYRLTNTMTLDSDQTALREWVRGTDIDVASLQVRISGSETTYAGGNVVYTVVYSNTGSWDNAPVTLTLDYGPYLTYVSSSLTPVDAENRVFIDTVPSGGSKTLIINLTTNAPLPYTLEEIVGSVTLASPGAPSQIDAWTTALQRPVFEFRKTGPDSAPVVVGGSIGYSFDLRNTGDYTATAIVITDTWDASTTFWPGASGAWVEEVGQGYARYTIPTLAPDAQASIPALVVTVNTIQDRYDNMAELSSDQTSIQETSERTWAPSIELSKTAYPDPAFPGRVLTYTLTYDNVGNTTISGAVITDTLPADFTYQGHTTDGAGCAAGWQFNIAGQVASWRCTTLSDTAEGQLKIWGMVAATAEETWLENRAESDGAPPVPRRPMDEPLRTLVARPWLRVNKVGAPLHPVAPGDHVTYTLAYENYGSYAAYDVVIKDQLPTQLTYTGCDPACTHNTGLVSWTIGELPVGATGEVTVYAIVKAGTGGQTAKNENYTIENTTIWQRLLPTETDQGAAVDTVILNPQLTLTKAAAPTVVPGVNATIVYTITYKNTGGGLLHNVVVTDALDAYTGYTSASDGCSHTGEPTGGTVTCQLGDLLNGESRDVVIRVFVSFGLSAGDKIQNQAQGRTDEAPLTSSNTTTVWYQIAGEPEIAWAPSDFTPFADEGSTTILQNTLTVSNLGAETLLWSLEVTPTTATWLKVSVSGPPGTDNLLGLSTAPGGNTPVTVYFNPTALAVGVHNASLRIVSNDADEGVVLVPVTFTILALGEDYYIYLPLVLKNY